MNRNKVKERIRFLLENHARAVLRFNEGIYYNLPDYSETILNEIEKYMIPKQGGKHQSSYDLAMGSTPEWDKE